MEANATLGKYALRQPQVQTLQFQECEFADIVNESALYLDSILDAAGWIVGGDIRLCDTVHVRRICMWKLDIISQTGANSRRVSFAHCSE